METILVDYAEVLSKPFSSRTMVELAQRLGLPELEFRKRYWNHRPFYDCGQSSREYWETIVGTNQELDDKQLANLVSIDVNGWLDLNPDAIKWLQKLHASRKRLWLLSNAPHPLADAIEKLPIAPFFEGMLFSARIGAAKPSQECFATACAVTNRRPERILFIDDRPDNIAAAAEFGMNTILFTGHFPALD